MPATDVPDFEQLRSMSGTQLETAGLAQWIIDRFTSRRRTNETIYLIPGRWYALIPEGYEVVGIDGVEERFQRGVTDNDTRGGYLAFGILPPPQEPPPVLVPYSRSEVPEDEEI